MKKYHPLMKSGRRDLLLLVILLLTFSLLCWLSRGMRPIAPVDRLIMSPIGAAFLAGALVYFLNILLPPVWGIDENGVRYTIYEDGSREVEFEDWIRQPQVREHLEDIRRLKEQGKLGPHIR